jgi:hypothetical protein
VKSSGELSLYRPGPGSDTGDTQRLFDVWERDTGWSVTSRWWLWTIEENHRGRRGPVFGYTSLCEAALPTPPTLVPPAADGVPTAEAPLSTEPVLGWRVWRLIREDEGVRLQALAHPDTLTPREAGAARCSRGARHDAPAEWCTCGYYAASSIEDLRAADVFSRGVAVVGAIAMWGKVVEHARGARSEYAYPARLRLVCALCIQQGRLAAPLTVMGDAQLTPVCRRHVTPRGQPSAAEIQAELLATYGVDPLPTPRWRRTFRLASKFRNGRFASGVNPGTDPRWGRPIRVRDTRFEHPQILELLLWATPRTPRRPPHRPGCTGRRQPQHRSTLRAHGVAQVFLPIGIRARPLPAQTLGHRRRKR